MFDGLVGSRDSCGIEESGHVLRPDLSTFRRLPLRGRATTGEKWPARNESGYIYSPTVPAIPGASAAPFLKTLISVHWCLPPSIY